ncbi:MULTISPECIES: Crp/Fnr family transcriptional regulator [Streptomycetaceae]|uniref:Crp/Fnr family transcriptional regulator n=1 Tax=Streptomycetaceae TaxID=2062 RepID=UPI00093D73E1|nr:Crp/Fnr family transcriptional regulator [Streptomyces sp. CB02056]OKI02816.1 hypothetical protein AMK13_29760 [Streptomyces sp. CB02056]
MQKLVDEFRRRGREVNYKNRELILGQGSRGDHVLLLTHGFVRVVRRLADGRSRWMAFRGPMNLLGEMSVLAGKPRNADVTALGSCKAVMVRCDDFLMMVQKGDFTRELLVWEQGQRVDAALARIWLKDHSLEVGLARTLLYLAGNGSTMKIEGLTREVLAQAVGVTRNALCPVLKGLKDAGTVATGREALEIKDIRALRDMARGVGRVRHCAR